MTEDEFRLECLRLAVQFGGGQDAVILARRYSDYVLGDKQAAPVIRIVKPKEGPKISDAERQRRSDWAKALNERPGLRERQIAAQRARRAREAAERTNNGHASA